MIIIARCAAPSHDENLKTGTKTILIVREWAMMRVPRSISINSIKSED